MALRMYSEWKYLRSKGPSTDRCTSRNTVKRFHIDLTMCFVINFYCVNYSIYTHVSTERGKAHDAFVLVPKVAPVQNPTNPPKTKRLKRFLISTTLKFDVSSVVDLLASETGNAFCFFGVSVSSKELQFCESPIAIQFLYWSTTGISFDVMALKKCWKLHKLFLTEVRNNRLSYCTHT